MQVGSTDPAVAHAHEEFAGLGFGARDLLDDETARFSQHRGAHRKPPCTKSSGGTLHPGAQARQLDAAPDAAPAPLLGSRSAREWTPGSGTDPAHVGGERVDVVRGDEATVGRHLDHLAAEEERADPVLGDPSDLAFGNPLPELVVTAYEIVEVRPPEARHVSFERARVRHAPRTERAMAGEAAELRSELGTAGGERLLG